MAIKDICGVFTSLPSENRGGSLAFFGCWLGGRPDGIALLHSIAKKDDVLILEFSEGERVEICNPTELEILQDALVIWQASSVKCYWSPDDQKLSLDNFCYYKFNIIGSDVYFHTNHKYPLIPKKDAPAFEMAWSVHHDFSGSEYHREVVKRGYHGSLLAVY